MIPLQRLLKNLWRLFKIAWGEDKWLVTGYFVTSFLGVLLLFAVYFAYRFLIDQVADNLTRSPTTILFIIIITYLFFEYLSRFVYTTINLYYFDYLVRSKFQNALTRMFMNKLADLDFALLERGDIRNLIAKVQDTYTWRLPENLRTINGMIYSLFGLILAFAVALRFNFAYFLILAIVSAPLYYLRAKFSTASFSIYSSNAPKTNYLWYMRYLFTNFQTLSEMKIYQLKDFFLKRTEEIQTDLIRDYRKPITQYTIFSSLAAIAIPVVIYFSLVNFVGQIEKRGYTIGDFTFFLNTLYTFSNQISNILFNVGSIYENGPFVNDYFQLLDLENVLTRPKNPYVFPMIEPRRIQFVDVSFRYPNAERLALENINLTIEKDEDIAIVGHNGAGKTTLIKLLLRFYDPTCGAILIDDIDLRSIDINSWYQHLGILFQDFARYDLSFRENVEFGDVSKVINQERKLSQSIDQAQARDVVETLPQGLSQVLGRWFEGGQELSTGQWQKVAIARAIYRNAPILILDEPTSNIDAEAEYQIFNNLKHTYKNKSLIFISHRFSTVRTADKIYVLEGGHIIEQGTHEELLETKGLYAKYFKIQKRGYE